MRERVSLPLSVDMDTGFGNALNVQRTVRVLERAGASALQMEDQVMPKRCGHMAGKQVIPAAEMVGKIKAALDARQDADTLIIARTDALAVTGFDDALERAEQYLAAGADALFIEAPKSLGQMQQISARLCTTSSKVAARRSPTPTDCSSLATASRYIRRRCCICSCRRRRRCCGISASPAAPRISPASST
jgi:2-methylisocitrate lyase-like PEP mutase family enzyme